MGRADELRARFEVELVLVELEEELVAAKADGPAPRDLKQRVRQARQEFRLEREGNAVANPAVIEVTADVSSLEG